MGWTQFDGGQSIGQHGSENGVILCDEEYDGAARITLEQDGDIAPFSITCGIYGWFFHTRFLGTRPDAETDFGAMKRDLVSIVSGIPFKSDLEADAKMHAVGEAIGQFVERFP